MIDTTDLKVKFCSPACKRNSRMRPCKWCNKMFAPTDARVIFCTRSCGAKWKMKQPEIVAKMVANKDWAKNGEAISRSLMANPKERKRRSALAKRTIAGTGWNKEFQGVHSPTKHEAILLEAFPEAEWSHLIRTGQSSKLGNPQFYKLDLAWPDIKLCVELDGLYHATDKQQSKDAARDSFLKRNGWCVLRYSNRDIKYRETEIKQVIESTILKLKGTQVTASTVARSTTAV